MRTPVLLSLIALASCGVHPFASKTCKTLCGPGLDCMKTQVQEEGCAFEDEPSDVRATCLDSCQDTWKDLNKDDRDTAQECIACVEVETNGSCAEADWVDAFHAACDSVCEPGVELFLESMLDDWEPPLVCEVVVEGDPQD
jgi:hypothetical protein